MDEYLNLKFRWKDDLGRVSNIQGFGGGRGSFSFPTYKVEESGTLSNCKL